MMPWQLSQEELGQALAGHATSLGKYRLAKPRALVTGAAGFVGRHMTAELTRRGWLVSRCDTVLGWDAMDIFQQGRHHETIQHYELVVHCAAASPHRLAIDNQPAIHITNQLLDAAMFDWALRTGQGRVIYLSSCAVLDRHDLDGYGTVKAQGEYLALQARAAGLPVTVVRPFSGYGADQGVDWPFGAFLARARARQDPFVIWGEGTQVRDWIHITDVVNAALEVAASGTDHPVSLCTGVGTSMKDLAQMMVNEAGYSPTWEFTHNRRGADRRVGNPEEMRLYYWPKVSLQEAVATAIKGEGT